MLISLLAQILIWVAIGYIIWYLMVKLIPKAYLTWFGGIIPILLLLLIVAKPESSGLQVAWHLLSLPLTPLGLALLLLALAFKDGIKKVKGRQVLVAFFILLICSLPLVAHTLVYRLEYAVYGASVSRQDLCRQGPDLCPVDTVRTADLPVDAIVIFNQSKSQIWPGTQPIAPRNQLSADDMVMSQITSLQFGAQIYRDRVYQNGNYPLVIVTGAPADGSTDLSDDERRERSLVRDLLQDFGVDGSRIRLIGSGMAVRKTVLEVCKLLEPTTSPSYAYRVAIVAPAMMLRRAGLAFVNEEIKAVVYASESYHLNAALNVGGLLDEVAKLIPSADALDLTTKALNEHFATIYYFLRAWLPDFQVLSEGAVDAGGTPRL